MGLKSKISSNSSSTITRVKKILISQPRPEGDRSPYFELEKKFGVQLFFHPFIVVQGIDPKEFKAQKVEIADYSAIIFTSRYAVDHFFRLCAELKVKINAEMKYFCITETIALYLQKFTLYRKRKVFFGSDGTMKSLLDVIGKHKHVEKFIVPCSDINKKDILDYLKTRNLEYVEATLYKTVCNACDEALISQHDMMVFFSPSGVKSLFENVPKFKQKSIFLAAFGSSTSKSLEDNGLRVDLKAPLPNAPSMVSALEMFLTQNKKGKEFQL